MSVNELFGLDLVKIKTRRTRFITIVISKRLKETMAENKEESQDESHNSEIDEIELSFQSSISKEQLNSTLSEIGVCPLKIHAISSHSIVSYGKKKLKQAQNALEQKYSHIQTKIAESFQVSKNSLENNNKEESVSAITQQKVDDFDYLMNLIKEKMDMA